MSQRAAAVVLLAGAAGMVAVALLARRQELAAPVDPLVLYQDNFDGGGWPVWDTDSADAGVIEQAQVAAADDQEQAGILDVVLPVAYTVANIYQTAIGTRMNTSIPGIDAIKRHEAFSGNPYKDQAGFLTIGYGHKIKPGEYFDSLSEPEAVQLLAADLGEAENAVNTLVRVPLEQAQFDALVSFVFNVGAGAFRNSTLLKRLNAGDYQGAIAQFGSWRFVTIGGVKRESAGLVNRRRSEAQLFASAGLPSGGMQA